MSRPLPNRLLFPSLPPDHPLPPLLLSSSTELSDEIYDLIALALRAYIVPWWSKISRYDKQLLPEITRILTTVIRQLYARLEAVHLPPLLFRHVPAILTQHYRDFRNAHHKLSTSYASGGAASLPQLFHQLQPHMAISSDGHLDTEYFRQLIDHILKACLPEEDYQPEAERFIVREIILKVLLNDVIPKVTQPWFIQRSILDLLQLHDQPSQPSRSPSPPASSNSLSIHTFAVIVLSAIQAISGACLALIHAYKQTLSTIKQVNKSRPSNQTAPPENYIDSPLTTLSEIFTLKDRTASTTLLATTHLLADFSSSFLDCFLPHLLKAQLSPAFILSASRAVKRTLFPNGYPGPPPIEPTAEEQADMRARLVAWRPSGTLGKRLLPLIFGPNPTHTLEAALYPISSAPCNVHLLLFLLDLVLLELFPELAVPLSDHENGAGNLKECVINQGSGGSGGSSSLGGGSIGRDGNSIVSEMS